MKVPYWRRELERCGFRTEFSTWLLRTITEGVDIGYRGEPRDHRPSRRSRNGQEKELLSAQYKKEKGLRRIVEVGKSPPAGKWFTKFFISPTYIIPKKRVIGQPQKWRLIQNLSSHTLGHNWSINGGIKKADFPVTYPSVATAAHEVFCKPKHGCVLWGRDMKAYYRHLLVNPAHWWCTGTQLEGTYFVDCYCPFGARSMPSVFQRLSDAIRVIMLCRTPVDGLLGMLDDFLGVTHREEGESDDALLRRGRLNASAFDEELIKMGITKQVKKDSPTSWKTVWLGLEFNTKESTIAIPCDKELAIIEEIQEKFFDQRGGLLAKVSTTELGKLVGSFCHMSQAWALGKTLLWPLYMLLKDYRVETPEGKKRYRLAQVELGYDAASSLMEWYERINVCGIYKKFYTCCGSHWTTTVLLWSGRSFRKGAEGRLSTKGVRTVKGSKNLVLKSRWGIMRKSMAEFAALQGKSWSKRTLALAIKLLLDFLRHHAQDCGDIIVLKTNVGAFARYIAKDCYPAGLARVSYVQSVEIHRLLSKPDSGKDGENRMMHPRQLKAWYML